MSKISNYNMELEEELRDRLNELGFESLQDALNAGYVLTEHVIGGIPTPVLWKMPTMIDRDEEQKAYEEAHEAWLKEKEEVLAAIDRIKTSMENVYGDNFKPEIAAIALDGDPDEVFRYSDVLKIKNFIEEAHE